MNPAALAPASASVSGAAASPNGMRRLDGALVLSFGILFVLLALGGRMLGDPDTRWHVEAGRLIWRQGAVPWTDPFSHTFAGAPWIAKEWLAQLLLAGAEAAAGWTGVAALTAVTVAATLGWMFWWLAGRMRWSVAFRLTLLALLLAASHVLARPHVFVFPVLVGWTIGLLGALERDGRPPWRLVPLAVLWANLHASFPLGAAIAGILALEAFGRAPAGGHLRRTAEWAAFGGAIGLAFCLTPYGWRALAVTLSMSGGRNEAMAFIAEWEAVKPDASGALVAASLTGAMAILLSRKPLANGARILLLGALGAMMMRRLRFVSLFALVAPLVLAAPLGRLLPPDLVREPRRLGRGGSVALVVGLGASLLLAVAVRPRPGPLVNPETALRAARSQGISAGPVFSSYDFGGYLIAEGVPTFMDGRSDQLFLGGFLTGLRHALEELTPDAFGRLLDDRRVAWALVQTGSDEARQLGRLPGWRRTHEDSVASVYARGAPR